MPPSQLKALKSQLRENGIVGPQKSKKQRKAGRTADGPQHQNRHAALQQIRNSFNPFELRPGSARPAKFESFSAKPNPGKYAAILHRPGVTKSAGEEMRRRQLLPEMQRRNKVGGLIDRRIGEGDATMTPEERAVQRFAREKERKKGGSLFDLEGSDGDEGKIGLTHLGRSLDEFDGGDMVDAVSEGSEEEEDDGLLRKKRRRDDVDEGDELLGEAEVEEPERKKTKKEVMEEVIAKSKLHKYERQKAKEDDDDLREQLDASMAHMLALLQGHKPVRKEVEREAETAINSDGPKMNPERQKLLDGADRAKVDKEYEVRLRQLAQDTRAKPSDRTKTAEERAQEQAEHLREMEEKRLKRMRGEAVSDDEDDDTAEDGGEVDQEASPDAFGNDEVADDAGDFGFEASLPQPREIKEKVNHDDEDDFAFDDDLIASDPEAELSDDSESEAEGPQDEAQADEEAEFVQGILGDGAAEDSQKATNPPQSKNSVGLAYTYPCPRSHAELLEVFKNVPTEQAITVIQRIRALYHPSLSAANKEAMADFSAALVDHLAYMANNGHSLAVTEQLIRHLHSLSRTYATRIGEAFRLYLQAWHERLNVQPTNGDLMIITAIGATYPTSDHFHQVVTPAITMMARWLGLNLPNAAGTATIGAFLVAQCLNYQKLSKRYIPETVRFTLHALRSNMITDRQPHLDNLTTMSDLWQDLSAFTHIFSPFVHILERLNATKALRHLTTLLESSHLRLRPLELHHHRLQPIRTSIPKFESGFNPDKHYDPDHDRSESRKLHKEVKRERKGALRELRKDANFVAREQLRDKRERDEEYERKQRRLVAEIQGEEGGEGRRYERVRERRKRERVQKKRKDSP
ncbi:hypothetical protein BAUCODRAFT_35421 [Baudoinia panamericana UAMH 10762]|uniref:Nop14-like protein n=1 Tax=Baudoinia panamericana (strain UAMH 10762) TaxID=717646 RepID=M2N8L6_BAUPA|nr:uncharacterized protein BAUCODRAFT_35421 [Baudoinia panamericana UAMH 10762]EMC95439.1 hypothetical protein BAUCODRAFT_35421 [Baudoinia panamericana UAMH 10762]